MKKISLYKILFEDKDIDNKDATEGEIDVDANDIKARHSKDSVDDQIDALILKYENSSIREKEDSLMESILKKNLKYLLQEQEEEEPATEEPAADEGETETADAGSDPAGSEDMTVDAPASQEEVPIDNVVSTVLGEAGSEFIIVLSIFAFAAISFVNFKLLKILQKLILKNI